MKSLLLLFSFFVVSMIFGQKPAKIYKSYFNGEDKFISNELILSTDGLFFSLSSCECGQEYYGKGTWQIKANTLYLNGFDSTKAFPHSEFKFVEGQSTDSITIRAFNYFKKPLTDFRLGLIKKDSTESWYEPVDKTGKLTISKKDYCGFFLIYEARDETGILQKNNYHHFFDETIKEIDIFIDFVTATFDMQPIPFNYGQRSFTIKHGNLYGTEKKPAFFLTDNND